MSGLHAWHGVSPGLPAGGAVWIAPGAHLIGDVRLGHEAGIWFNAVLRGDNEPVTVGEGTNVQDGAVLHTDPGFPLTVGRRCTIGHLAMLHGCTVGDGALIGMKAMVMNGARIGAGALVAAGAIVTEGREVPEGMLAVGAPARVIRPLRDEERQMLLRSAEVYIGKMRVWLAAQP
jgi:carbonic anhydrase/acetyltransferase-like protein (isoleucine patch superfamily)